MNERLTPEQAINLLYAASRRAAMTADDHALCMQAAQLLLELLSPPDTAAE